MRRGVRVSHTAPQALAGSGRAQARWLPRGAGRSSAQGPGMPARAAQWPRPRARRRPRPGPKGRSHLRRRERSAAQLGPPGAPRGRRRLGRGRTKGLRALVARVHGLGPPVAAHRPQPLLAKRGHGLRAPSGQPRCASALRGFATLWCCASSTARCAAPYSTLRDIILCLEPQSMRGAGPGKVVSAREQPPVRMGAERSGGTSAPAVRACSCGATRDEKPSRP